MQDGNSNSLVTMQVQKQLRKFGNSYCLVTMQVREQLLFYNHARWKQLQFGNHASSETVTQVRKQLLFGNHASAGTVTVL